MSLTPIEKCGKTPDGHIKWLYLCDCGKTTEVSASRVKNGYTKSCGCLTAKAHAKKHGYRNTPTYSSWTSAKDRATNPDSNDYHRYGAVGIGMAYRWMMFENFLKDMGERPPGTSLDRMDNSRGYEPGNCRWATACEQQNNRRNTVFVSVNSGVMPVAEYARSIGISEGSAYMRLKRNKLEGAQRV